MCEGRREKEAKAECQPEERRPNHQQDFSTTESVIARRVSQTLVMEKRKHMSIENYNEETPRPWTGKDKETTRYET
jgi:hypothetical protein